ncbi:hypothetical protein ACFQNE_02030 [Gordonia phosphorivorans]|uniref:Uncharacterized protein n=1 Tax=Gordonia phosphorivorans TaxID=1056982 RepID=A0ABV6H6N6_9ACTN
MAKRTLGVATWEYRDKDKKRRRAYFGDEIDVSAAEIRRGDAAGVWAEPERRSGRAPAKSAADADATTAAGAADDADILAGLDGSESSDESDEDGGETADAGADAADDQPTESATEPVSEDAAQEGPLERPKNSAPVAAWVEYAVSHGMDRADAEASSRADLIKADLP